MTRDEANAWLAQLLMDKIREDAYPSATQMAMVEEVLPREMVPEYLEILMERVERDNIPSIPLLQRIMRVAATLPRA
jgi:hypothetical protein